ncbi:hypothetical protein SS50377_24089 [Spironucleus salmonicida]|uniref:Uncharacterized protein n=1 Tax=Spironucleus salmonicida TaxID=348837 RepID=V6LPV2_9EUKA|nr:hypothetical protein SS50377_24089 [Spironucleus salmonicida]|eukprot:EST46273.1 Hypothetical protein SS50377_13707 [Spironucleus salmonicida]
MPPDINQTLKDIIEESEDFSQDFSKEVYKLQNEHIDEKIESNIVNTVVNNLGSSVNSQETLVQRTDLLLNNISKDNLKQSIITQNQNKKYQKYSLQIMQNVKVAYVNQNIVESAYQVIVGLMATAESCFKGKKLGQYRQQVVLNSIIQYLSSDDTSKRIEVNDDFYILLKQYITFIFEKNKKKLLSIFNDIFEISKSCMQCFSK